MTENVAPKHVIVGIDIGMTCTGVAICSPDRVESGKPIKPVVIQSWPGTDMHENKVPTRLTYKAGNSRILSWGFACPSLEDLGPGMAVKELFKFYLDKPILVKSFRQNPQAAPGTFRDVVSWYTDFLTALYGHIIGHLKNPPWLVDCNSTKIEYIFSLPTLWRDKDKVVGDFEEIVKEAGFGTDENCSVVVGLTEGEASAVSTAESLEHKYKVSRCISPDSILTLSYELQEGDTILVCDAGGGTTDICVLKVNRIGGETVELMTLDEPNVLDVGSLDIDDAFERNAAECLSTLRPKYPQLSEHIAHQITRGAFQAIKTSLGTAASVPTARILVPGLPVDLDERVVLSRDELKAMFDEQIHKIFDFIDKEIQSLQWDQPGTEILYLVLSGGLGSSRYVQTEFTNKYSDRGMTVLFADEPEEPPLAVCKGLVIDRMQRICHNASVLRTRRSRASYGILYSERYDKNKHSAQNPIKNPLDGNKYAENRIDWLIHKGGKVTEDEPITRKYSRIISPNNPDSSWKDGVVISYSAPGELPLFWNEKCGAHVICNIVSDLGPRPNSAGITQKRKKYIGKKFLRVDYDLLAFIEPERLLRFEVMVGGEARNEPQTLRVEWTEGGEEGNEPQNGFYVGV